MICPRRRWLSSEAKSGESKSCKAQLNPAPGHGRPGLRVRGLCGYNQEILMKFRTVSLFLGILVLASSHLPVLGAHAQDAGQAGLPSAPSASQQESRSQKSPAPAGNPPARPSADRSKTRTSMQFTTRLPAFADQDLEKRLEDQGVVIKAEDENGFSWFKLLVGFDVIFTILAVALVEIVLVG